MPGANRGVEDEGAGRRLKKCGENNCANIKKKKKKGTPEKVGKERLKEWGRRRLKKEWWSSPRSVSGPEMENQFVSSFRWCCDMFVHVDEDVPRHQS